MSVRPALLGVPFDPVTREEAIARLLGMLKQGQHHVMTPNAEMLVEGTKNPAFLSVMQKSDLNLADSTGVVLMSRILGPAIPMRVTGVDTVMHLCGALTPEHPVFLLGAWEGTAAKAAAVLSAQFPNLKIAGTFAGSPKDADAADIIGRITESGAHLLLVAYGAPKQDLWIHQHLKALPQVRVAMGVGGTFDFIAGMRKRAPQWMRALGLEWLWRVVREPKRIGRILNAVVVFPLLVLRYGRRSA